MTEPTWWDATAPVKLYPNAETIKAYLKSMRADRYAFGLEKGEQTGYEHWQIRVVFKEPKALKKLKDGMPGVHWSPTKVRNFDYVEKEGNYYRSWEEALDKWKNLELKPWEEQLLYAIDKQSDREIAILVDVRGGLGKTTFAKHLVATKRMEYIPQMASPKDYMHVAFAKKNARGYVIDLCMGQDFHEKYSGNWQATFFNAVEQMKNGFLYDGRNAWKECWTDPKDILIMMNQYPEHGHIADDRVRIFEVNEFELLDWRDKW